MEESILMSRQDGRVPWGFRLQGGSDYCQRLSVQRISPDSLAATSGLQTGDCIVYVNDSKTDGLTHAKALELIKSCGNKLILSIVRYDQQPDISSQLSRPSVLRLASQQSTSSTGSVDTPERNSSAQPKVDHFPVGNRAASGWPGAFRSPTLAYSSRTNQFNGFRNPSAEEVLSDKLGNTYITTSSKDPFTSRYARRPSNLIPSPTTDFQYRAINGTNMNSNSYHQQQEVPDQLLNQFASNKRPEDKPFTYIPSGGIEELQQRQREVRAPPVKPKPRTTNRQASQAGSESSQNSYDPASLFTPAYREMMKNQQEMLSQPSEMFSADAVGFGPDKVPHEDVAAYILQPDGTMSALRPNVMPHNRWNDRPGPDMQNSAVMAALMEEQNAQMHGTTSGKIHSANNGSKHGLSFKVLQWLTGTDSEDGSETASNYSGSHDGQMHSLPGRRLRHQSFDSNKFPEQIREDSNGNELSFLYNGSNLPSKSFRRLLRSVSSTASTDDASCLSSPLQESPSSSEDKPRRHGIKIVSRGASQEKAIPQPHEQVAYSDF